MGRTGHTRHASSRRINAVGYALKQYRESSAVSATPRAQRGKSNTLKQHPACNGRCSDPLPCGPGTMPADAVPKRPDAMPKRPDAVLKWPAAKPSIFNR